MSQGRTRSVAPALCILALPLDIVRNVPGLGNDTRRRYIANLICDNNLYVNISKSYVLHTKIFSFSNVFTSVCVRVCFGSFTPFSVPVFVSLSLKGFGCRALYTIISYFFVAYFFSAIPGVPNREIFSRILIRECCVGGRL